MEGIYTHTPTLKMKKKILQSGMKIRKLILNDEILLIKFFFLQCLALQFLIYASLHKCIYLKEMVPKLLVETSVQNGKCDTITSQWGRIQKEFNFLLSYNICGI